MSTKFPSLEVISNKGPAAELVSEAERKRMPRLNLTTEQFRLAANGKVFPVSDLSNDGMALRVLDRNDLLLFPIGREIEGLLNLKREKHKISARVRHLGTDLVGCQFETLPREANNALIAFLDPAGLGSEMEPIPAPEPGMLWYHGPSGTHLMLWRAADGQFSRFAVVVMGTFVQWNDADGAETGRITSAFEPSETRGVVRFETTLWDRDSAPDPGKLEVAKTVIMSSNLPQDLKGWCARHLKN